MNQKEFIEEIKTVVIRKSWYHDNEFKNRIVEIVENYMGGKK